MFYLAVDWNIQVQTLHPDNAEELFELVERNRSRLRPWIDSSALPETITAARRITIECFFNSMADPWDAKVEYADYFQELDGYSPPLNPPMELGIWMDEVLTGVVMLGRQQNSLTTAEFGYWIDQEKEGLGIVTRCVSGLMDYAVDNLGIERFVIGCAAENQRSSAIPKRLGYRLLTRVPDGEVVGNFIYDRLIYEMWSTDWREQEKSGRSMPAALSKQSR